jgi:Tol biopolymer transport system component
VSDPLGDDAAIPSDVTPIDSPPPMGCVSQWLAGTITTAPVAMPNVNSAATDVVPFVSSDGNTFYFASTRDDPANFEIYRATRSGMSFSNITVATDLNSTAADGMVSISSDGRSAFVATERMAPTAGRNFWEATRANTNDTFAGFTTAPFANVNGPGNEFEIWASPDRLRIYVSANTNNDQTLAIASRSTTTGVFSTPSVIAELNGTGTECCVSLSADERVIIYRTGANETLYATRPSRNDAFSTPKLVPGAAPPNGINLHTFLSPDACTLYFATTRTGGPGGFDIWTSGVGP